MINIRDIARIAGVGVSTVSRVINNHPDVKEQTRERVLEIIRENNYIPNNSARNLKKIIQIILEY
jgi:LacI family transcriptional regulator